LNLQIKKYIFILLTNPNLEHFEIWIFKVFFSSNINQIYLTSPQAQGQFAIQYLSAISSRIIRTPRCITLNLHSINVLIELWDPIHLKVQYIYESQISEIWYYLTWNYKTDNAKK
jgi:hypothetical protein